MAAPDRPAVGQVVTVFRNRLRAASLEEYADELSVGADGGRGRRGLVWGKSV